MFIVKYEVDETLEGHKVRFIINGYTQNHWIDYQETFALVVRINTIYILLSLATKFDWPL